MIRKFLTVAKYVTIASSKPEEDREDVRVIDLVMPIQTFWEIRNFLQRANYLMASQEPGADVQEVYRKIFKTSALYAVYESDRLWLYERALPNDGSAPPK